MPRYRAAVLMLQQQCNTWLAFVRLRFPRWKPDNVATVSIANEHLAFHSNTSRSCLQSQPDSYLWQNSSSNVPQLASVAFNQLPSGVSPMCTITDGVVAHTLFFRSTCESTSSGVPAVHDEIQWLAVVMISPHTSLTAMLQNVQLKASLLATGLKFGGPRILYCSHSSP